MPKHSSQTDHSNGFGGKFGIEKTRQDKAAAGFEEQPEVVGTNYQRTRVDSRADIKGLKNRFENTNTNEELKKKAEALRQERINKDKLDKEQELKRAGQTETKEPSPVKQTTPPVASFKSVSSSPFKQQQFQSQNTGYQAIKTPSAGKINSPFLQNASDNSIQTTSNQFNKQPRGNVHHTISSVNQNNTTNGNSYSSSSNTEATSSQQFSPPPNVTPVQSYQKSKSK